MNIGYSKFSTIGKCLFWISIFLILVVICKKKNYRREGFDFLSELKTTPQEIYDSFYAEIYDSLVLNNNKNQFEIEQLKKFISLKNTDNCILDIGCGTGHHVNLLIENFPKTEIMGIDISPDMIAKAKDNYPHLVKKRKLRPVFQVGDASNYMLFHVNTFTHVVCFYFTIYYFKEKGLLLQNCFDWLKPGGYLVLHLVDPATFDPVLPPGNPLLILSPQRYAKTRITKTKIHFDKFEYQSNFEEENNIFHEKFFFPNGQVRRHAHSFFMEPMNDIVNLALEIGFILHAKIHLIKVAYDNQFLFVFLKA